MTSADLIALDNLPALIGGAVQPSATSTAWADMPQWAQEKAMECFRAVEDARKILALPGKGKQKAIARATGQNYGSVWRWIQCADAAQKRAYQQGEDVILAQARALAPNWGRTRNRSLSYSVEALRWVIRKYASQSSLNLSYVYEQLLPIARVSGWKIGSYKSLSRIIDRALSPSLLAHARLGDRKWEADFVTKILRNYDEIWPNFGWVSDHHIFDVFVKVGNREVRPWVTAFMDLKSRSLMGWCISTNPSSQTVALALRHSILPKMREDFQQHGLPLSILLDNGKDYRCQYLQGKSIGCIDYPAAVERFAALGVEPQYIDLEYDPHEKVYKRKTVNEELVVKQIKVGGVFARLGVNSRYATVYHPWAKPIERLFRGVVQNFSRAQPGWCGTNPQERPEKLTWELKRGLILSWEQFCQAWEDYVVSEYHLRPQRSEGMHGRCPTETYLQETAGEHRPRMIVTELLDFALLRQKQVRIYAWGFHLQGGKFELDVPSTPEGAAAVDQLIGRRVDILYEPTYRTMKVFWDGRHICAARPLRKASWMPADDRVFQDKIRLQHLQKKHNRTLLKLIQEPDTGNKINAAITPAQEKQDVQQLPLPSREDEVAASGIEMLGPAEQTLPDEIADRPDLWLSDHEHYRWCIRREAYGLEMDAADRQFMEEFQATEEYQRDQEVYEGEAAYHRQAAGL